MEDMRHNGSPPFGYKRVDGKTVEDDFEQAILHNIRCMQVHFSLAQIADQLNSAGIKGPRGGKWTRQYISRVLKATPQSEN